MDYEVSIIEIDEIIDMGYTDDFYYDVGMEDTPHTFFANDILVHNSMFISAVPLLDNRYPDIDYKDFETVSKLTLEIVNEVQEYVNKSFDVFAKRFLNLDEHKFQVKQEVIAESGFWVSKKRYALKKFKENGLLVKKEESREVKGLDVKKSNFPSAFRDVMFNILDLILELNGKTFKNEKSEIDNEILEFKRKLKDIDIVAIASPTSCKGLKKYSSVKKSDFKIKKTLFTDRVKGCPAHVRAALNYNDFLKYYKLDKRYELIQEGSKIKWIYLKKNEFNIETIAMKGYDDPKKLLDFIKKYIDYEMIFSSVLKSKLKDFYVALNWGEISDAAMQTMKKFFSF